MDTKEPKIFYEPMTNQMIRVSNQMVHIFEEENKKLEKDLSLQHVSLEDFLQVINNKETLTFK